MTKKVKDMYEKALKLYYNELATAQLKYQSFVSYNDILEERRDKYTVFFSTLFDIGVISAPEREAYITEVYTAYRRVTE